METRLIRVEKEVIIALVRATVQIGERIDPSGRNRLEQDLKRGDLAVLEQEARV